MIKLSTITYLVTILSGLIAAILFYYEKTKPVAEQNPKIIFSLGLIVIVATLLIQPTLNFLKKPKEIITIPENLMSQFVQELAKKDSKNDKLENSISLWKQKYKELEKSLEKDSGDDKLVAKSKKKLMAGDLDGAEKLLVESKQGLLSQKNIINKKLANRSNQLGQINYLKLKYSEAQKYLKDSVKYDPNNSQYLNDYGVLLIELGGAKEAIKYLEKAVDSGLKTYGPGHPKVAFFWSNLGGAWSALGKHEEAIKYFEKSLASNLKSYGHNHSSVIKDWSNIGTSWKSLDRYNKAIEYLDKASELSIKIYGINHPIVARCWNYLGSTWELKGKFKKAIKYYEKALSSDLKTYGPDHPQIASYWNNLAGAWLSLGKFEKAIEYIEKAVDLGLKTYGPDHPEMALFWSNMGNILNALKKPKEAIGYLNKAADLTIKIYGIDHHNVAQCWGNLGSAWELLGKYEEAIEYYEKALTSDLKTYGTGHSKVAERWSSLGIWSSLGKHEKAIEYYEKALASDLKTYGPDHPTIAKDWHNIGGAWLLFGQSKNSIEYLNNAIEYLDKALNLGIKIYGVEHHKVAITWNTLGLAWELLDKHDKAFEYYKKALTSDLKTYGNDHSIVAKDWNNLGKSFSSLGKYEKAIESFNRSLFICNKTLGKDHVNTKQVERNLMGAKEKLGKTSSFQYSLDSVKKYIEGYHQSIKTLLAAYNEKTVPRIPALVLLTNYELWQCIDGVVVLSIPSTEASGQISIHGPLKKSMSEFLSKGKDTDYYDQDGQTSPKDVRFGIRIGSLEESIKSIVFVIPPVLTRKTRIYKPRYVRAIMAGWEVELSGPTTDAVKDFKFAFATDNIIGDEPSQTSTAKKERFKDKAYKILSEYKILLDTAEKEEELQVYLKKHPELMYPDLIEVFPKLSLGAEYETDFVVLYESGNGPEYVFIEIENPNKHIFTKKGYFHSDFTQAKNQLIDWNKWITKNWSYLEQKLPGLHQPTYHLIYGRDQELDESTRETLKTEFSGTTRNFSTYDGIAQRFETIIMQLSK